jgi:hypothetical protein
VSIATITATRSETLTERCHIARIWSRWTKGEKSRDGIAGCGAAEKRDEVASPHDQPS